MAEVTGNENKGLSAPNIVVKDVEQAVADAKAEAEKIYNEVAKDTTKVIDTVEAKVDVVKTAVVAEVPKVEKDTKTLLQEAEAEYENIKQEVESKAAQIEHVTYDEFVELRDAFIRLLERVNLFNANSPHKL